MSVGPTRGPVQRPGVDRDLTELFQRVEDLERVKQPDPYTANIANSGTQSITNGAFVAATFDTVLWDTDEMADLGTHNDRLTVAHDGYYIVAGEAIWLGNADSAYRNTVCQAYTSGGGLALNSSWAQAFANVNGQNTIQNPSGPLHLTAGMYVRLLVFNGAGAPVTLGAVYLTLTSQ